MSFEGLMRKETVSVFLTDEDQMCLRRLMEQDTHEPGDMTASEAVGGVVSGAVDWIFSTMTRLCNVEGVLVLRYPDSREEEVDLLDMFQRAVNDGESETNTEVSLSVLVGIRMLDILCEFWAERRGMPVDRGSSIRFAIRWRHYCLRTWLKKQDNPDEPELGIRFVRDNENVFVGIAI